MNILTLRNAYRAFRTVMDSVTSPAHVRHALSIAKTCERILEPSDRMATNAQKAMAELEDKEAYDGLTYSALAEALRTTHPLVAEIISGLNAELESEATLPEDFKPLPYDAVADSAKLSASAIMACGELVEV